jgi:hypothetical protein
VDEAADVLVQTHWMNRSLGRVETTLDVFRAEVHADMQTHTGAIIDLRERVTRLEA